MEPDVVFTPEYVRFMEEFLREHGIDIDSLTLANDRVFASVLMRGDNAKQLIERVLGITIGEATVSEHHARVDPGPGSKWVELDVVVRDAGKAAFDIEMQSTSKQDLARRARYYLSALDAESSAEGLPFYALPNIYSIFICLEDPFGLGYRRYTCRVMCDECGAPLGDGTERIFLNAQGKLGKENADITALFDLLNGHNDVQNEFARRFAEEAEAVKRSSTERLKLMKAECDKAMYLKQGHDEGYEEGHDDGFEEGHEAGYGEGHNDGVEEGIEQGIEQGIERALAAFNIPRSEYERVVAQEDDKS